MKDVSALKRIGFYDSFGSLWNAKRAYELIVDVGEEAVSLTAQGVKKTKISQAFIDSG